MIGHLGKAPKQKDFDRGGCIVSFSLATTERWKTKDGERKEHTNWHRCVVQSEPLQKVAMQYLKKGSKIYVEGMVNYRSWDDPKTGDKRNATEIALKPFNGKIVMLDKVAGSRQEEAPDEAYEQE